MHFQTTIILLTISGALAFPSPDMMEKRTVPQALCTCSTIGSYCNGGTTAVCTAGAVGGPNICVDIDIITKAILGASGTVSVDTRNLVSSVASGASGAVNSVVGGVNGAVNAVGAGVNGALGAVGTAVNGAVGSVNAGANAGVGIVVGLGAAVSITPTSFVNLLNGLCRNAGFAPTAGSCASLLKLYFLTTCASS